MEGILFFFNRYAANKAYMLQFDIVTTALINHQNNRNHLILCQKVSIILKYANWEASQPILGCIILFSS